MRGYLIPVMGLCFGVDALLLAGTNRLTGHCGDGANIMLSAGLGAVHAGACVLPPFSFLGGTLWRLTSLGVMGLTAFGVSLSGLRRTALYMVLNMAVGGLSLALGGEASTGLAAVIVCALCLMGLWGTPGSGGYVPVVLHWGDRREQVMALRDTGNTLRDPVTGEGVLVVSGEVACRLFGLQPGQLNNPVDTMTTAQLPGLRLIPYKAVGAQGLLLAIRLKDVQIGNKRGSRLVAFAPNGLGGNGKFQALTGGAA